jgi:hypothetical protein
MVVVKKFYFYIFTGILLFLFIANEKNGTSLVATYKTAIRYPYCLELSNGWVYFLENFVESVVDRRARLIIVVLYIYRRTRFVVWQYEFSGRRRRR